MIRNDHFMAIDLPRPYPHPAYGRWDIECEVTFRPKRRKEDLRRLKTITLFVLDSEFKRQAHVIESFAERLWLPYDPAGVSLGHELGAGEIGGVRQILYCATHKAIHISLYPPDEAAFVTVDVFGSIMSRIRFQRELKPQ